MDTYGWVSLRPFQPKQAILRTGFDFDVFFCKVLQFQLVRSLTRRWTYCINSFNCSHSYELYNLSLCLIRQCDVGNLVNKQFWFQIKWFHVCFVKMSLFCSLLGPAVLLLVPPHHLFATWELCSWNCFSSVVNSGCGEILRVWRFSLVYGSKNCLFWLI